MPDRPGSTHNRWLEPSSPPWILALGYFDPSLAEGSYSMSSCYSVFRALGSCSFWRAPARARRLFFENRIARSNVPSRY
jgi:hypothetical protein